ncbi:peroxisomal sarcosine oxidase-like isoform X2 [Symsagittifera roscoffensis]|uniref:peroxisomal sarcosine oxidase-like isoform X2 n=1 Tax=Symsagittifera roscoffensis TaxID=84072 RepID=UPI00307C2B41
MEKLEIIESSEAMYDVIVLGAGIVGSSAAYQAQRAGNKTLLIEQFAFGHSLGSSHGGSRVIRHQYGNERMPEYAEWMPEAYEEWEHLEQVSGETLLNLTGGTSLFAKGHSPEACLENLRDNQVPHTLLTNEEATAKYPMIRFGSEIEWVLEEASMGAVYADRCLRVTVEQFIARGGVLKDGDQVVSIAENSENGVVTVKTKKESFEGRKLIICAGTWINQLLQPLGVKLDVKITKITICYWKETDDSMKMPTTQFHYDTNMYLIPEMEHKGYVKFLLHEGPEIENPEDSKRTDQEKNESVKQDMDCLKEAMSPDAHFVLDKLPGYKNIVAGAAFSGHGFKMAPVSGKILKHLALDESVKYNISKMNIQRLLVPL